MFIFSKIGGSLMKWKEFEIDHCITKVAFAGTDANLTQSGRLPNRDLKRALLKQKSKT